jgi:two-component system, OmpR family, sensor kinase
VKVLTGSMRWRLFFLYLLLTLIILFSAGSLVYFQVQNHMINNRLSQTDELVSWALTHSEPQDSLRADDINQVAMKLAVTPGPDFSFFLLDINGLLIQPLGQGNPKFEKVSFTSAELSHLAKANESVKIINKPEGYDYRIMTIIWPVYNSSGTFIGAIQSEIRLDEADEALSKLRWLLILGFVFLLFATSGLWLIMTRVVIRPLVDMANFSKIVSEGDFNHRATPPKSKDEAFYTILAFNKMLDNIQASISREKEIQLKTRQFLADASHELRSPLTVLKGFVDVLKRGAKDDPKVLQHSLEMMSISLGKMTHLINDMLKLSQLEAETELNMTVVDLNTICLSTVEAARIIGEDRQVEFVSGPQANISGDARLLEQALWNLLENSIRHTASKGKIIVEIRRNGGQAIIKVQDNGEGIAAEHLPKLFERFYRVDKANPVSTGLGLAITRAIIVKHGGKITVQSTTGLGTTFTLSFPLAEQ